MKPKSTILQGLLLLLALLSTFNSQLSTARAQGTAFTYQGRLSDGTNPATGVYDLRFTIYDAAASGTAFGAVTNVATGITNGLFTVTLDFGGVFNGANYWLEIAARTNGGGAFSALSPRQPVTPAPYAMYSANASSAGSVAAANIVGTLPLAQLPAAVITNGQIGAILNGTFTGNGGGLTNLPAASLTGTVADSLLSSNIARLNIPNTNLQATANAVIISGFIVDTTNLNGGMGYPAAPLVTVTDVSGSNAIITATISNGVVTSLTVQAAGLHYSAGAALTIAPPPSSAVQTFSSGNVFNGVNTMTNGGNNFAGTFNVTGDLFMPATTTDAGIVYSGGSTFIHAFGANNFFAGAGAGNLTLSGNQNVGVGPNALHADSSGSRNAANGYRALAANTTGSENTAAGNGALQANTTGSDNVAAGTYALWGNTTGNQNTANGAYAMEYNNTGFDNTANGYAALTRNTTGIYNTADGAFALTQNSTGSQNTALGAGALQSNTTGLHNTASGYQALAANTNGSYNVAVGYQTLGANTSGSNNTAIGDWAMNLNTTGQNNTAEGHQSLYANLTGSNNVANGYQALWKNTIGHDNTANGFNALELNTNGIQNTANGGNALLSNTSGSQNTANGFDALANNTTGPQNTASGAYALGQNTVGGYNTADGWAALYNNSSGNLNTAVGQAAMDLNVSGANNVALGYSALFSNVVGNGNIALGYQAGINLTNGNNDIYIGNTGNTNESGVIRIGTTGTHGSAFIAGVITGNGAGLTNVNATSIGGVGATSFWKTTGNSGTTAGVNFVGTSDNQPLELRVNGVRALRLEPNGSIAPNVVGGAPGNFVAPGYVGSTIGGGGHGALGYTNSITANLSTIGGGHDNTIQKDAYDSVISGGGGNTIETNASYATIGGGWANRIQSSDGQTYATIGGGNNNSVTATEATVAGGGANTASGYAATIAGGWGNQATNGSSAVGGGTNNLAGGYGATVPGGFGNLAGGNFSFAAGSFAQATHNGAFVWSDGSTNTASTVSNQFMARASGGVVFYSSTDTNTGVALAAGSGSWSSLSDRNAKDNFMPVDAPAILARVAAMPLNTWHYKTQDQSIRHLGPVAQDFYAAFGVGEDARHITTIDSEGVALAAIQGLNQKVEEKDAEITQLKQRLDRLEQLLGAKSGGGK